MLIPGPQFTSKEFEDFLKTHQVKHVCSAVYNPQENGKTEVFNRFLKAGIQANTASGTLWQDGITLLLKTYRATSPTANAPSPAELFLGRKPRLNMHVQLPKESIRQSTTEKIEKQEEKQVRRATQSRYNPYRPGDTVVVRLPTTLVRKGQSPWSKPLQVTEVLGRYSFRLTDGQKWNARRMKRWYLPSSIWCESDLNIPPADATTLRRSTRFKRPVSRYRVGMP